MNNLRDAAETASNPFSKKNVTQLKLNEVV